MKRPLVSAVLLALGLILAVPGLAGDRSVSWTLTGTSERSGSGFLAETFAVHGILAGGGTYSGTLSAGTYSSTVECGPLCAPVTGTIELETRRGTVTTSVAAGGFVTVLSIASGTTYTFELALEIDGGTRSYSHASGTLELTYSSLQPTNQPECPCAVVDNGTLTGQISRRRPT
jgi:hypothetical protein